MLQLTEHKPGPHHYIRQVSNESVVIDDERHVRSLIVGARLLHRDWPVCRLGDLSESTAAPLLEHQPEIVILGWGDRAAFPAAAFQRLFLQRGIGLECMTLAAACRTFNVLMSENRRAIAGLILSEQG